MIGIILFILLFSLYAVERHSDSDLGTHELNGDLKWPHGLTLRVRFSGYHRRHHYVKPAARRYLNGLIPAGVAIETLAGGKRGGVRMAEVLGFFVLMLAVSILALWIGGLFDKREEFGIIVVWFSGWPKAGVVEGWRKPWLSRKSFLSDVLLAKDVRKEDARVLRKRLRSKSFGDDVEKLCCRSWVFEWEG